MELVFVVGFLGVVVDFMIVQSLLGVVVDFVVVAGFLGVVLGFLGEGPGILIGLNLLEIVSLLEEVVGTPGYRNQSESRGMLSKKKAGPSAAPAP